MDVTSTEELCAFTSLSGVNRPMKMKLQSSSVLLVLSSLETYYCSQKCGGGGFEVGMRPVSACLFDLRLHRRMRR